MMMAMAGRASEEIIYGKDYVTTGASNDFQQATRIAHHMVTKLGKEFISDILDLFIYLLESILGYRDCLLLILICNVL
jgi:hypothetical protein